MPHDTQAALPALDPETQPWIEHTDYPEPFQALVAGALRRKLGDATGLTNFGVNLVRLPSGSASSQRHWHTKQDEFVFVLEGELVLVTDAGEQVLTAGMAAGFPAGVPDGHHLINRSGRDALYLEIGDRTKFDDGDYPDLDMVWRSVGDGDRYIYLHRDGTPW